MKILKCPSCQSYGLQSSCSCGGERIAPKPPKYSPEDKYAKYRRMWKHDLDHHDP
ncbi:MAG: nucleolar RNA-binding Nop10p family protein [Nanoarchaeota archaeon]